LKAFNELFFLKKSLIALKQSLCSLIFSIIHTLINPLWHSACNLLVENPLLNRIN